MNNNTITIWQFDKSNAVWVKSFFDNVRICSSSKITKNGILQHGFFSDNNVIIRIPTSEDISVKPGNYVTFGKSAETDIPFDVAEKIIEVRDNRKGLVPHYKIVCGNF